MTIEGAIISLIGAIISGVLATIVTLYINHKNEIMREKRTLVSDIFGYRFLLNGNRDKEKFCAALNRVPIIFCKDSDVIHAYDELYDCLINKNQEKCSKNGDDALVSLLKALCKATKIDCGDWNDSKVLKVFEN